MRLGFERQCDRLPGALGDSNQMRDVLDQVVGDRIEPAFDPGFEGAGHGADAAVLALGQQLDQDVGKLVRVAQAQRIAPVGAVRRLLHGLAVE